MPRNSIFNLVGIAFLAVGGARTAQAQPAFSRTILVDPTATADANYTKIQDAINAVPANPAVRYTILIYAGTYDTQAITLGNTKENVDLVGVDRDAVIIKPPANTDAITIQGDGARNNTIGNLTIITDDDDEDQGRGIVIKEQTTGGTPTAVKIVDVTIKCDGEKSNAIEIEDPAEDVEIRGVGITTTEAASHAVVVSGGTTQNPSKNIRILDSRIGTNGGVSGQGGIKSDGLHVDDPAEDIEIRNTFIYLEGLGGAVNLDANVSDIDLEKVTVRSTGQAAGMYAPSSTRLRMANCDVLQHDGNGIIVGTDTRISNSSIIVDSSFGGAGQTMDDNAGISADAKSGLRVSNSKLRGRREGMRLVGNCTDAVVTNCELIGSHYGAFLECGAEILFQGCLIVGDSAVGMYTGLPVPDYHGVFIDDKDDPNGCEPGEIRFVSCDIRGVSGKTDLGAYGVRVKAAPSSTDGPVEFIDCTITSRATAAGSPGPNDGKSFGVVADEADAVALIGGCVSSSDADEREPDQFDLLNNAPSGLGIGVSGRKLSKWKGPIFAAGRKQSVVQRTIDVSIASDTKILNAKALTGAEQPDVLPENQPDVYRVLSAKGNQAGMSQPVYIIGADFGDNRIVEKITLVDMSEVEGYKPFKTVTKIILPAQSGPGQTVSVGTTGKLGLYFPISATSDVLQQGRKAAAATSYTLEAVGAVDATYATLDPGPVVGGESFEWAILASE